MDIIEKIRLKEWIENEFIKIERINHTYHICQIHGIYFKKTNEWISKNELIECFIELGFDCENNSYFDLNFKNKL